MKRTAGVFSLRYALLGLALCGMAARAAEPPLHGHEPLRRSEDLSFDTVFESALRNAPETLESTARERQARDYREAARGWLAGRPSFQLGYYDDALLDNQGLKEIEYGLQLPLRRPGEKAGAQALGRGLDAQSAAWRDYLRLYIAGRVRLSLAAIQEAVAMLELEEQATADARELLEITEALFQAGEAARLDVMQGRTLLLEQQKNELQAEAAVVDAEREYAVLTGLEARPAVDFTERPAAQEEILPAHPELRLLQSGIDVARAQVRQAESAARGSPTVSIGSRRERGDRFQPYVDSIALSLSVPIGGKALVSARTSDALRGQADAEVAFQNASRRLGLELHEVEHELFLTGESLELAREQAELDRQRWEMARSAFEAGESDLTQVVMALQQVRRSEQAYRALQLARQRLASEYNHVIGVLP